jgi:hypothetical protein
MIDLWKKDSKEYLYHFFVFLVGIVSATQHTNQNGYLYSSLLSFLISGWQGETLHWIKDWGKFLHKQGNSKGIGCKFLYKESFLIYEKMREYLVIYEEAVSHIPVWLCTRSLQNSPSFFYSVPILTGKVERGFSKDTMKGVVFFTYSFIMNGRFAHACGEQK